jgi:PPP family 3-phenylpropionic acid transporter
VDVTGAAARDDRVRLARVYAAAFVLIGVYLPYWTLWLEHQGLSPAAIGLLLALAPWGRLLFAPLAGRAADAAGGARPVLVPLTALAFLGYGALLFGHPHWAIAASMTVVAVAWAAIVPLLDAATLVRPHVDYGRTRAIGSLSFIVAVVGAGPLVARVGPDAILYMIVAASFLLLLAAARMPGPIGRPLYASDSAVAGGSVWRRAGFRHFLAISVALQVSHALYYAFGTLHWQSLGWSEGTIGALWAEGVAAEVLVFAFASRLSTRLRPAHLLVIAGISGIVRWTTLGLTTTVAAAVAVQWLHGLSFGMFHVGSMGYLRERFPEHETGAASGVYFAISSGLAYGVVNPLLGPLFEAFGGLAYFAMVGCSALGTLGALPLLRSPRWTPEPAAIAPSDAPPAPTVDPAASASTLAAARYLEPPA